MKRRKIQYETGNIFKEDFTFREDFTFQKPIVDKIAHTPNIKNFTAEAGEHRYAHKTLYRFISNLRV